MLCVYDKLTKQNEFGNVGYGFLKPLTMSTREELNGEYAVDITYPITRKDTMWMYLTPWNIVRNSEGQLFYIHTVTQRMQNGLATLEAQCRHISYYLADKTLSAFTSENVSCQQALNDIKNHIEYYWTWVGTDSRMVDYDFSLSSNVTGNKNISFDGENAYYALVGSDVSILNLYGGELHRNNFSISINQRKQGSRDYAFSIEHGLNMLEISETVSSLDMVTACYGNDNYGNGFGHGKSWLDQAPHQILKHLTFSYSDGSNQARLGNDVAAYLEDNFHMPVSYEVRFKDLRNHPKYRQWMSLQSYNIGDTGTVKSELLGIETQQKIISRTINDITGEVESVTLGNFLPDMFRTTKYGTIISKNDISSRRLSALESSGVNRMFTWENGESNA